MSKTIEKQQKLVLFQQVIHSEGLAKVVHFGAILDILSAGLTLQSHIACSTGQTANLVPSMTICAPAYCR